MRCSRCGADNADDLQVCSSCGARLDEQDAREVASAETEGLPEELPDDLPADDPEVSDEQVDELMGQLPTVAAERAAEETRLLKEHAALAEQDTQLMDAETRLIERFKSGSPDEVDDASSEDDAPGEEDPAEVDDEAAPVEQLERTQLRPAVEGEQQPLDNGTVFVVRNTRDYDHDAQSHHHVKSVGQFATISEERESRLSVGRDPYAKSARRGHVPGEGNSRGRLRPLLAILLVALVLGGGAAVVGYGMEMWGGKKVPGVTGKSQAVAEESITGKGLVVVVEAEPADDGIGLVISQEPEAGQRLPEGGTVVLHVATNRVVPEVVGKSEDEARALLKEAGAESVMSVTQASDEPEGTVIAVDPGVGEAFVSRGDVTLTIAGPYTVPDVIDKKETDAVADIEAAGFATKVTYIDSDKTVRTVVETSPAAGSVLARGETVEIKVSSPYPSSPYHLAEFFAHSSQDVDGYLKKEGFAFAGGATNDAGMAVAAYTSSDKGNVAFSSEPHSHQLSVSQKDDSNVLATGMPFAGVRIDLPSSQVPGSCDRKAVEELAKTCGFGDLTDFCDNKSITLPSGEGRLSTSFACASGKMDDLVWTVIVVGEGGSAHASATCAKEGLYGTSDLATFGGSVSQYAAYQEVYVPYQIAQREEAARREAEEKEREKDEKEDHEEHDGED